MKAAAAETVLLAGLLALAGYVAWDTGPALGLPDSGWLRWITGFFPGFISVQAFSLATLLIVTFWALQALGHRQLSFWLMAGFAVLPHAVPIWGHNQLEWYELFGAQAELIGERMLARDAALFLASLAGLVMLHRIISLRDLERRMTFQGISTTDKGRVLQYEGLLLVGLLAAGLSLALLTVLVATLLGRYDAFLTGSTWAAGGIGAGASALLALTLLLWRRGR